MALFGLVGKDISYSFSKKYFTDKFTLEKHNHQYINIDLTIIDDLLDFLANNIENLKGFNVTIPYKEAIFKYLDEIDYEAQQIGAVNCVKIIDKQFLKGFNTDIYGFEKSILPLLEKHHTKALILGTGGASKAVAYTLKKLKIDYKFVSRNPKENQFSYQDLDKTIITDYTIIINTTPLGTKDKSEELSPNIPYQFLTKKHLLYDLIYNPLETVFLKKGKEKNTKIKNGLEMLKLQADKSWEIWEK
jgi:shikimate dehydrogenase